MCAPFIVWIPGRRHEHGRGASINVSGEFLPNRAPGQQRQPMRGELTGNRSQWRELRVRHGGKMEGPVEGWGQGQQPDTVTLGLRSQTEQLIISTARLESQPGGGISEAGLLPLEMDTTRWSAHYVRNNCSFPTG